MSNRPQNDLLSFVLPVFNECDALHLLEEQIRTSLAALTYRYELVFVNDGSHDGSEQMLDRMAASDKRIRVVHFSRNFGHQPAVQAGLEYACGDAIIVMDSDLQDDPGSIPEMVEKWRQGFDVVFAIRFNRKEGIFKRLLFFSFYRLLNAVSNSPIPNDAGNFGLIDRRVAQAICSIPDADRYYAGLRNWTGFRQTGVLVERQARHDDRPRVSWFQLLQLAKSALFSFSRVPLSVFYAIALLSLLVCCGCFGFTLYHKLMTDLAIPGWTSNIVTASFSALSTRSASEFWANTLSEYTIRCVAGRNSS